MTRSSPRIAFLRWNDDRAEVSGMPWNMSTALDAAGCDTENVLLNCTPSSLRRSRLPSMVRASSLRRFGVPIRRFARSLIPDRTYETSMQEMSSFARIACRRLDRGRFDAIFAVNMSGLVAMIETKLPIVYATDATATLANDVYPSFASRRKGQRDAAVRFETMAADRADRTLVASEYCRRSMCEDHGADPSKVRVVPLGANLVPNAEDTFEEVSVPTREGGIELVVAAADPERKRVALCADVTEELRNRGWRARLHYIGPRHDICRRSTVEWAGQLDHGLESDRMKHRGILRRAHLSILPSIGEMYGIAPIESAAVGRPSIVSATGGLTTVVQDGVTGRCLPVDTPVTGWADAIESMVVPADRYRRYSSAAISRYQEELNWGAWGRRARAIMEEVL